MTAISIELTPEQIAQIQRNVVSRVTDDLYRKVLAISNAKQFANEVKNLVVKRIADKMVEELKVRHNVDETLHRAVQSAESRVQTYIQNMLSKGITVRFGDIS